MPHPTPQNRSQLWNAGAEDVADTIAWAVTRPPHVNIDLLVVRPRAQAAQHKVARDPRT